MLEGYAAGKSIEAIGKGACYVVGAGALAAGAYVTWWTLDAIYGWGAKALDNSTAVVGDAKDNPTNPIYWAIPAPIRVLWNAI